MITVVTLWETTQMEPELEWRMWRQLKGAFQIDRFCFVPVLSRMDGYVFDQFDTVEMALMSCGETPRAFLEPTGYNSVSKLPQDDIVLVCGNTQQSNIHHAQVNETYQIYTPKPTDMYGINAAAIALAVRYGQ